MSARLRFSISSTRSQLPTSGKAYLWGILHSGTPRARPWPHGIENIHGWNNPSRWFLNADTLCKYQSATGNFRFSVSDIIASNFISCKNFFELFSIFFSQGAHQIDLRFVRVSFWHQLYYMVPISMSTTFLENFENFFRSSPHCISGLNMYQQT